MHPGRHPGRLPGSFRGTPGRACFRPDFLPLRCRWPPTTMSRATPSLAVPSAFSPTPRDRFRKTRLSRPPVNEPSTREPGSHSAVGALLSMLARLSGGKAVVEVGTGARRQWTLAAVRDARRRRADHHRHRARTSAHRQAGVHRSRHRAVRTRLIAGRAQEVLTRLADESYDLVFIDSGPADQPGVRRRRRPTPAPGRRHRRAPSVPRRTRRSQRA